MTIRRGRTLALLLTLSLILTMLPVGLISPARAEVYGLTTAGGVRVRKAPRTDADYWFLLDEGHICIIEGEVNNNKIHWYKVTTTRPEPESTRTYVGYIHGDFFRKMTDAETQEWLQGQARATQMTRVTATPQGGTGTPTPVPTDGENTPVTGMTGTVFRGGTNFRQGPSMHDHSLMKLDNGTVVEVTSVPAVQDENHWFGVRYAGQNGYIRADCMRLNGTVTTPTQRVTATPTATPTGGVTTKPTATVTGTVTYNAVKLILSSCHLRETPGGKFDSDNDWVGLGSILPLAGSSVNYGGNTWYPVTKGGRTYYVRSDCVQIIQGSATPTPTPTGTTPTATPTTPANVLGYVQTIKGGVNLRSTIGGTVIKQIAKFRTLGYLLPPVQKSGYTWYYVEVDGNRGYVRSDVVKVLTSNTPTPGPTATVTSVPGATGYVRTIAKDVNLRSQAGYSSLKGRVALGVVMPYFGTPTTVKGVTWYHVKHDTLGYGYIHGSYVNIVNPDGSATPTPTVTTTGAITTAGITGTQKEASYTTLKLGSTGNAVKNLVEELKKQGYYTGDLTNRYTSAVQTAVRAFQRAKGLSVDGIAGEATQHALFGTVPVGTTESLTMTLYPAEKIDWWTGGINELWVKGTNYKIYDVKTGVVWWAHRWSGGYHVDAEPLTASDTAKLCKCYGVTTASEIASRNLYERRPCLVTIGNRTFACSLYGVPHNYPEGDTISTNNFKGQLCIHFTNSWTHGSKKVDSLHTEAIQYAYEHAPNGHK